MARDEIPSQHYILHGKGSYTFGMIEAYFRQEQIVLHSLLDLGNMEAIKELGRSSSNTIVVGDPKASRTTRRFRQEARWLLLADIEGFTPMSQRLMATELEEIVGRWIGAGCPLANCGL